MISEEYFNAVYDSLEKEIQKLEAQNKVLMEVTEKLRVGVAKYMSLKCECESKINICLKCHCTILENQANVAIKKCEGIGK